MNFLYEFSIVSSQFKSKNKTVDLMKFTSWQLLIKKTGVRINMYSSSSSGSVSQIDCIYYNGRRAVCLVQYFGSSAVLGTKGTLGR